MKYKIPLYSSFTFSAIGISLLYLNYQIAGQIVLIIAFLLSLGAFKSRGSGISAFSHFIPAAALAWFYFTPSLFPFLSLAIILASLQNIFLEMFFPGKIYNDLVFKIVVSIISVLFYIIGNILYPAGIQAWIFPGITLLFVDLLSSMIIKDTILLKKVSAKGYIKAGSVCPDFTLPDETGNLISVKDFKGKYFLLIFVRGDWCPGCHIMLRCYEKNREKFAERGVSLLSIGPDPLGINKNMVQKLGLNYHILSDEKQMVGRQFCVELQDAGSSGQDYDFIPLPASFLIDKEGVIRYTSRADVAGEILNPDQIFQILDSLK
jgi:peroxiredoxin Q/BCP